MAIVQEINLNLIPDSIPVIVRVDQYDTGVGRIVAHLYEGPNAYTPAQGATAIIQGTKPDMKGFSYNATINGSSVVADLTNQMSAVGGNTRCQFVITEPSGRTGTFAFVLKVQDSALSDDTDISETELPAYIDAAQKAAEDAEAAAGHYPYIDENTLHWMAWDVGAGDWYDTGVVATGGDLTPGDGIKIQSGVISVDADSTPTEDSPKPVTSGGVYAALEDKMDALTPGANIQIEDGVISATDTTYTDATTEAAGLMSAADKTKLNGIESGAQVNVQADWTEADSTADAFIKNKPNLATVATSGEYSDLLNKPTLGTAAAKNSTNEVTSGSADLVESGAVKDAIDAAISSTYKAGGSKTCAQLVSSLLVEANEGYVYNMSDAGTTTADFVEGAGQPIKIGDNVGIVKVGSAYKFDLLAGMVDLSSYQTKAISSAVEGQSTVEGALGALSTNKQPKTLSSAITVDGAEKTTVESALSAINTLAAENKANKQDKALSSAITVDGVSQSTVEGALGAINTLAGNNKTNKQDQTLSSPINVDGTNRTTVETALSAINTLAGNNKTAVGKAYSTDDTASTDLADADYIPFYDSSATAKKKTLWSNIKSVLKSHFDEIYATIASVASKVSYDFNARTGVHNYWDKTAISDKNANLTVTQTIDGIDVATSANSSWAAIIYAMKNLPQNTDFVVKAHAGITSGIAQIQIKAGASISSETKIAESTKLSADGDMSVEFNTGTYASIRVFIYCTDGTSVSCDLSITDMLIKMSVDTSDAVTPYAMTNAELTEKVFEKGVLTSADDLNDITTTGIYCVTSTPTNTPDSLSYYSLIVSKRADSDIRQMIIKKEAIYTRTKGGDPASWSSWYKFTGTVVS